MFDINYINTNKKYVDKYMIFFSKSKYKFNIKNIELSDLYSNNINKSNKLYKEYCIFKYLYDNGGLFINGNFKFVENIDCFFENDFFVSFGDDKNISTNLIWSKNKDNSNIKNILKCILEDKYDNITEVLSCVLNDDLKHNFNTLLSYNNEIYIYPYEYFYPIDYEKCGKDFTDNLKAIYYTDKRISFKLKFKLFLVEKFGTSANKYIFTILGAIRNKFGCIKYMLTQKFINKFKYMVFQEKSIRKTLDAIDNYKEIKPNYVIIHNPKWLGVTSATKELFENLVPLEEVYSDKNARVIAKKIIDLGVKQVIFSAFNYGWDKIAIYLKELNKDMKIKSFWHGSHSQVIEKINWETNLMVINLHKKGIIDVMGTCKESLVNFYKVQGYKTAFIMNTVVLENKEQYINNKKEEDNYTKVGLYSAGNDWRKNTYNQLLAVSLIENSLLEAIPFSYNIQKTARYNNLKITGSNNHIKREELLKKMSQNDINIYVTFSECAPMLPIESLEVGTICITGSNHHYFNGSKLFDYLVVEREDDVIAIYEKIKYALENKEKIFELYKEWKKQNDILSIKSVEAFLEM